MHKGKLLRVQAGRGGLAMVAMATMCLEFPVGTASAQTVDYFSTPWIVAPSPFGNTNSSTATSPVSSLPPQRQSSYSSLYAQSLATSVQTTPPVQYSFNLGIDEIATDNVGETALDPKSDLSSLFSAGATVTADTARLSGVLAATGFYRRNIVDTDLDQFSEYAYANGQAAIIPGNFYVSVNGMVDDFSRAGGGVQNPLLQSGQDTHTYTIGASPYLTTHVGDIGFNVLRYQIGQAWFSNNTGAIEIPGLNIGPITSSTDQTAREDFKMAGTVLARLMSDVSLSGTEDDSGNAASGDFQKANGELINEYEITRATSLIGGAGYESLHDLDVPAANGPGAIWDIGGRLRPNADSSLLVIYGRHDLKSDFSGELSWRLTPITSLYADYTDSLTSVQQSVISNNAGSVLGPDGAVSGVTFDRSTLIGVLDDATLNAQPGNLSALAPVGIPLATSNNYSPLQNGLFRAKVLSASSSTLVDGDPLVLTASDAQYVSLTPLLAASTSSEGGDLSWSPGLSPHLSGFVDIGYAHLTGAQQSNVYSAAVGATYLLSESISIVMRYDYIRRQADPNLSGYIQNAVTLGLHKSFD